MGLKKVLPILLVVGVLLVAGCTGGGGEEPEKAPTETTQDEPEESQEECVEDWSCTEWSECSQDGTQTRTCTDENDCGTTENKPPEEQSCEPEPEKLTLEVGETAQTSKLEVTVNSAEVKKYYTYSVSGYQSEDTAPQGKEYLIAEVEFENVGENSQYISSGAFSTVDSESYKYDVGMYMGDNSLTFKELYPGDKAKGKILFEVPEGEDLTIRYNFGFWDVELANWEVSSS